MRTVLSRRRLRKLGGMTRETTRRGHQQAEVGPGCDILYYDNITIVFHQYVTCEAAAIPAAFLLRRIPFMRWWLTCAVRHAFTMGTVRAVRSKRMHTISDPATCQTSLGSSRRCRQISQWDTCKRQNIQRQDSSNGMTRGVHSCPSKRGYMYMLSGCSMGWHLCKQAG